MAEFRFRASPVHAADAHVLGPPFPVPEALGARFEGIWQPSLRIRRAQSGLRRWKRAGRRWGERGDVSVAEPTDDRGGLDELRTPRAAPKFRHKSDGRGRRRMHRWLGCCEGSGELLLAALLYLRGRLDDRDDDPADEPEEEPEHETDAGPPLGRADGRTDPAADAESKEKEHGDRGSGRHDGITAATERS